MTDRRRHRGAHPKDAELFSQAALPSLRSAIADLSRLLSRGYPLRASLALVGDRDGLTVRQRPKPWILDLAILDQPLVAGAAP